MVSPSLLVSLSLSLSTSWLGVKHWSHTHSLSLSLSMCACVCERIFVTYICVVSKTFFQSVVRSRYPSSSFSGSQMFPTTRRRSILATCAGTSSECPVPFEPSVFSFRSFPGSGTHVAGLGSGFVPSAMQWLDSVRMCHIYVQFTIMFCIIN